MTVILSFWIKAASAITIKHDTGILHSTVKPSKGPWNWNLLNCQFSSACLLDMQIKISMCRNWRFQWEIQVTPGNSKILKCKQIKLKLSFPRSYCLALRSGSVFPLLELIPVIVQLQNLLQALICCGKESTSELGRTLSDAFIGLTTALAPPMWSQGCCAPMLAWLRWSGSWITWQFATKFPVPYVSWEPNSLSGAVSSIMSTEQGSFCLPRCYIGDSDLHMLH